MTEELADTDSTVGAEFAPPGDPHSLFPEKQFGSTRLIRRVGTGGMGEVWLARHELLGRDVAIKFLLTSAVHRDDPAFQTFIQGAKIAASVEHPALNKIFHADIADNVPYLVLEFLDGSSLAEIVGQAGPLSMTILRAIIEPVCDAVAELHHRDLLHRDIKPANIMLTIDGRPVLTDFGLARSGPVSALRSEGAGVAGTPAYMAPEMFEGTVSPRTDVYAIGMTAYYLLCGSQAFSGSVEELKSQHKTVPVNTEPLLAVGVSDEIVDVIVRATAKDILFRPKTARHLLEAFRTAFDAAGIVVASGESLTRLVTDQSSVAVSPQARVAVDSGSSSQTLADFAARKREQRTGNQQTIATQLVLPLPSGHRDQNPPLATRRRVWISALASAAIGTVISIGMTFGLSYLLEFLLNWFFPDLNNALAHHSSRVVWVFLLSVLFVFVTSWSAVIGGTTFAYRRLRGRLRPAADEHTRCGWCQHELHGITEPICPECGHYIGDRGPDEQAQHPPARQRWRRIKTWILLPVIIFAVYFPVAIVTPLGTIAVHYLRHRGPADLRFAGYTALVFGVLGHLSSLLAALWYYESVLKFRMRFSGDAWCRACGNELRNLAKSGCPRCGVDV